MSPTVGGPHRPSFVVMIIIGRIAAFPAQRAPKANIDNELHATRKTGKIKLYLLQKKPIFVILKQKSYIYL